MEVVLFPVNCHNKPFPVLPQFRTPKFKHLSQSTHWNHKTSFCRSLRTRILLPHRTNPHHKLLFLICNQLNEDSDHNTLQDDEVDSLGVKAALSVLKFYKREISPLLPKSCRYVPTCSEYSMEAYKRYGFVKGTVLTAWRICRCNPFGGSGFDPPRWFDERSPPQQ